MKPIVRNFLALGLLCLVIAGCGGSSGDPSSNSPPISIEVNPSALATAKPGELLALTKDLLRLRANLKQSGNLPPTDALSPLIAVSADATTSTVASTGAESGLRSGTNIQEAGVDEDDLLKIDGNKIYALQRAAWGNSGLSGDRLHVYMRAADGSLSKPSILELPVDTKTYGAMRGMLSVEGSGKLALLGESNSWLPITECLPDSICVRPTIVYSEPKTVLQWVDVSANAALAKERLVMDGQLIGARQIQDHVYLTLRHRPRLAADQLPANAGPAALEAAIAALKISEILPMIRNGDGIAKPLVAESDCYLQTANKASDLQVTVIVAWKVSDPPDRWTSRCFFGGTQAIYMSPKNLYLATSRNETSWVDGTIRYSGQMRTDIHQFAIKAGSINYMGSGDIPGHLGWDPQRAAYRMSEYQGDLRVLTFTGSQGWVALSDASNRTKLPSPATLSVLRPQSGDGKLGVISTLPNTNRPSALGLPGEQIYGVRFDAKRAYLVTFRQTDPLYILDLSDPLDPRMLGELKMPGYSDYLFPLANDLLLGVGKDATQTGQVLGVRVALMDLKNPSSPKELQVLSFGDRGSTSGLDYSSHGINLLQVGNIQRIALPLGLFNQSTKAYSQGLQALEVDVLKPGLRQHQWIASSETKEWNDISSDRSIQIGDFIYYWSRGQLSAHRW